jgi:hypothetical protein
VAGRKHKGEAMTETLASRVERVRQLSIQAIEGPWHVVHNSWDTSTIYGAENNCVAQCLIDEKCTEENQEEFELSKDCSAEFIANAPAMASLVSELWELVPKWITLEQFQSEANEGWCWIVYKGRVTEAYHDHVGFFKFHRLSDNCYMTECISAVMPFDRPAPPQTEAKS